MRALALLPLFILAACSGDTNADQQAAQSEADNAALKFEAGQWETTTEITKVTSRDNGTPVLKVGKTVASACVGETEGKHPPAAVLAGIDKAECAYDNIYISHGRVNAAINCKPADLSGKIMISVDGAYTATTFEAQADLQTNLPTDGDAQASAKITGRKTGTCPAPATTTAN